MTDRHDISSRKPTPPETPDEQGARRRLTITAEQSVTYNSPLVPPEVLEGYKMVLPDSPERILAMVERQEAHRHHLEKTVVEEGAKNAARSISATTYTTTLFVALAAFMVYEHYVVYGIVTAGSTLITLAGLNVYGKTSQKNERVQKDKSLKEDDESRQRRRRLAQGQLEHDAQGNAGQKTSEGGK